MNHFWGSLRPKILTFDRKVVGTALDINFIYIASKCHTSSVTLASTCHTSSVTLASKCHCALGAFRVANSKSCPTATRFAIEKLPCFNKLTEQCFGELVSCYTLCSEPLLRSRVNEINTRQ